MVDSALVSFSRRNIFAESLNDSSMKPSLTQHETTFRSLAHKRCGTGTESTRDSQTREEAAAAETHLKASPVQ